MTAAAMKLGQLRRMGLAELSERSRQQVLKWLDRVSAIGQRGADAFDARSVARFQAESPARFFAGADARAIWRATGVGEACTRIVGRGRSRLRRAVRSARLSRPLFRRPDRLAPRSGVRAVARRSCTGAVSTRSMLPVVGDSKVVWELNRHQWLVQLGQAYRLTGDERYAEVFADRAARWMAANRRGMGINWASSLEAALRLIAWCWALDLFRGSPALTPELVAEMLRWMAIHAAHVERYLSYYFSPNTHLTGEALGPVLRRRPAPRARAGRRAGATLGRRILVEQSDRQVHRRRRVLRAVHLLPALHGGDLPPLPDARRAQRAWRCPPVVAERVQRMLDFLLSVRRPDGSMPQIGDSDGGWLLPLEPRTADDLRGVFSTAAALFERADYAWAAGGTDARDALAAGRGRRSRRSSALDAARRPARRLACLRDGGYVVMRNGWATDAHQLIFDVGPLGCPHSGGHGHADLLSVQCAAFGEPYLVDAGTGSYAADRPGADFFRSSAAHSTVVVDGIGPGAARRAVLLARRGRSARLRRWVSSEAYDLADAEHDAYRPLADPVVHRRRVLFVKPRYWVVVDDLDGSAEHRVELGFQFAPVERGARIASRGCARRGTAGTRLGGRPPASSGADSRGRSSKAGTQPAARVALAESTAGDGRPRRARAYAVGRPRFPIRIVTRPRAARRHCSASLPTDSRAAAHVWHRRNPEVRPARARGGRAPRADARRAAAPRPGRRRPLHRRSRRPRPPASVDRRCGRRPPADGQRGRVRLDHLQRRDLQPRAAAAGARAARPPLPDAQRHGDDPAPLRGGRRAMRRAAAGHVRVRDLGSRRTAACCSRATGSASSRCTTPTPATSCCSPPRSRPSSPPAVSSRSLNQRILPEFLATRFVSGRRDVLSRHPQAAAGPHALVVARATGRAERRYWSLPSRRRRSAGLLRRDGATICATRSAPRCAAT